MLKGCQERLSKETVKRQDRLHTWGQYRVSDTMHYAVHRKKRSIKENIIKILKNSYGLTLNAISSRAIGQFIWNISPIIFVLFKGVSFVSSPKFFIINPASFAP